MTKPAIVPAVLPRPFRAQTETGAPTAGSDCGIMTFTYLVQSSSRNKVTPAKMGMTWPEWVAAVRQAMGVKSGATGTDDWARAWRSPWLAGLFRRAGLEVPKMTRLSGSSWDTLKRHLRAGRGVGLCVRYGTLRRSSGALDVPVGSDTFSDGHALALFGLKTADGLVWTNDADPLFDGTPAKVPTDPVVARLAAFKAAAGAFGSHPHGFGKVEAVSVPAAAVRVPPVEPGPSVLDILEDAQADLDRAQAGIDRARDMIREGKG